MTAFPELARVSAERMLNGVIAGVVVALLAGLLLRLMGRRNSGARFAILLAALFSIAALPLLSIFRASAGSPSGGAAVWAVNVPELWATYVVLAWAAIAMAGLARVAVGFWQLHKLRAGSEAVDLGSLDPALQTTLAEFRCSRPVRLAVSEKLTVPAALGFFRPMIVLPSWALSELSTAELKSILIHELAHLQRRDDWTNLAQKVLRALLFFHPAIWWVEGKLSLEREMACDDVVLSRTTNPRAYAECLVAIAERSFMRRGLALAQAAVSKMRQTTQRVSQILSGNRSPATRVWQPALALVTVASGIFAVGLARAPEVIAFRNSTPVVSSSLATVLVPASLPKEFAIPMVAKAVPASFAVKPQPRQATARVIRQVTPSERGAEILAKAMLPASWQSRAPAQTVLVVMHSEQLGSSGESWTVYVWRFTVLRPEQVPSGLKTPAKST